MIGDGKAAGWLQLPPQAFLPWAELNNVAFTHVTPGIAEGRGGALLARQHLLEDQSPQALLTVPQALILSLERIAEHAKVDKDFREVLESLGEFGKVGRLHIVSLCSPIPSTGSTVTMIYSLRSDELQLLVGTTLAPAAAYKLKSLHREYDKLQESAADTRWFQAAQHLVDFDDWLQVDAMYRSRALDFPGIGHCMVPCIDLANHTAGEATIAIYERDRDGNAILLLRPGKSVAKGEEITITYGDEKGACEMLFSYGFLEHDRQSAETVFLSLSLPDNDPFRAVKTDFADCAPGFKLINTGDGETDWTGEFIWLLCVSAEDGLHFDLARTVDGGEEVHAFFGEHELTGGAPELYTLLGKSSMWDVFRLRAVAILQQRVFEQMQVLYGSRDDAEDVAHGEGTDVRERCYEQAMQLRRLEFELLERAYEDFEKQKVELAESEAVKEYLARMNSEEVKMEGVEESGDDAVEIEDFS
ncbi:hypothetical protein LTR53_012908 [Teratosphaeriaceae sp. CCFEE 6253]|nr:hypothetical protein LTR53_012908 [Teratosphaeriaceae sp. CCFEE 6253]